MPVAPWVALVAVLLASDVDDAVRDLQQRGPCVPPGRRPAVRNLVGIGDLAGVRLALKGVPTTAVLENRRHPTPDRQLPGGLRITTRCDSGCCVDGLIAGGRVLLAAELDADDRRACRGGWVDRVVRVAFQDSDVVSIYVARSWFDAGAAHANDQLRCRSFDLATGRPLKLGDVLPPGQAKAALERARKAIHANSDLAGFTPTAAGIRFRRDPSGHDVQFCAEGPYPSKSEQILELDAR